MLLPLLLVLNAAPGDDLLYAPRRPDSFSTSRPAPSASLAKGWGCAGASLLSPLPR